MGAKFTIVRVTGEGEQISCEITAPDKENGKPVDIHAFLTRNIYKPMDARLAENSRRIMDAMGYAKNLPPEGQMAVKHTIDMIYGRAQALPPVDQDTLNRDAEAIKDAKAKALVEGVDLDAEPVIGEVELGEPQITESEGGAKIIKFPEPRE